MNTNDKGILHIKEIKIITEMEAEIITIDLHLLWTQIHKHVKVISLIGVNYNK